MLGIVSFLYRAYFEITDDYFRCLQHRTYRSMNDRWESKYRSLITGTSFTIFSWVVSLAFVFFYHLSLIVLMFAGVFSSWLPVWKYHAPILAKQKKEAAHAQNRTQYVDSLTGSMCEILWKEQKISSVYRAIYAVSGKGYDLAIIGKILFLDTRYQPYSESLTFWGGFINFQGNYAGEWWLCVCRKLRLSRVVLGVAKHSISGSQSSLWSLLRLQLGVEFRSESEGKQWLQSRQPTIGLIRLTFAYPVRTQILKG